ncbi:PIN domain-containing protein [Granulicella tundricola]|uniref:PIN domain-containing protein n=1 Tax=Granulicella tundricola (strain ATCC BAA-1859 / DSM 23138 / MP5ACTX9) TaxID=1198114 RepID=E8WXC7_GRATM|nr:hypothetical protein [Granulicella tundricola]ADW67460.1 hypothetical protein AciX9_0388 [Granulicella tundricola MP5ACTX9]
MTAEEAFLGKARGSKILLDTNLLLLLLIGSFDRSLITRFKRTSQFTPSDFDALVELLSASRQLVTTPHLLTEVSSLANALPSYLKLEWHQHLAEQTSRFFEVFIASETLMKQPAFLALGLADSAVFAAAAESLVLTEDYRLAGSLRASGMTAMSFSDLRAFVENA